MNKAAPKVSMDTRLIVNPNMVLREEGDEGAILFDPDSGAVRILNITATAIWKHLAEGRTLSQVMQLLSEMFDGMDDESEEQVLELADELVRIGALGTESRPP